MKYTVVVIVLIVALYFQFASTKENGSTKHHSHAKVKTQHRHHHKLATHHNSRNHHLRHSSKHLVKHHHAKSINAEVSTNILDNINNLIQNGLHTLDGSIQIDASISTSPVIKLIGSTLGVMQDITQNLAKLPRNGFAQLSDLLNVYQDTVQDFVAKIPAMIQAIKDGTTQNISTGLQSGMGILEGLNGAITGVVLAPSNIVGFPIEINLKPVEIAFNQALSYFQKFLSMSDLNNLPSNVLEGINKNIENGLQILNHSVEINATISSEPAIQLIENTLNAVLETTERLAQLPKSVAGRLGNLVNELGSVVQHTVNKLPSIIKAVQNGTAGTITNSLKTVLPLIDALNNALETLSNSAQSQVGGISNILLRPIELTFDRVLLVLKSILNNSNSYEVPTNVLDELNEIIQDGLQILDGSIKINATISTESIFEIIVSTLNTLQEIDEILRQLSDDVFKRLGLVKELKVLAQGLVDRIPSLIGAIEKGTAAAASARLKNVLDVLQSLKQTLKSVIKVPGPLTTRILKSVEIALSNGLSALKDLLRNIDGNTNPSLNILVKINGAIREALQILNGSIELNGTISTEPIVKLITTTLNNLQEVTHNLSKLPQNVLKRLDTQLKPLLEQVQDLIVKLPTIIDGVEKGATGPISAGTKAFSDALNKLNKAVKPVVKAAESNIGSLGSTVLKPVGIALNSVTSLLKGLLKDIDSNVDVPSKVLDNINDAIQKGLQILNGSIEVNETISTEPIVKLIRTALNNLQQVTHNLSKLPQNVLKRLDTQLKPLLEQVQDLIVKLPTIIDGMEKGATGPISAGTKAFYEALNKLNKAVKAVLKAAESNIGSLGSTVLKPIGIALHSVTSLLKGILKGIDTNVDVPSKVLDNMSDIIQKGLQILNDSIEVNETISTEPIVKLITTTLNNLQEVTHNLSKLPQNVLKRLDAQLKPLLEQVHDLIVKLPTIIDGVEKGATGAISAGTKAFSGALNKLNKAVKAVLKAIESNIGSLGSTVLKPVGIALNSVTSLLKGILKGIDTNVDVPSKVLNNMNDVIQKGFRILNGSIEANATISTEPTVKLITINLNRLGDIVNVLNELPPNILKHLSLLLDRLHVIVDGFVDGIKPLLNKITSSSVRIIRDGLGNVIKASDHLTNVLKVIGNLTKSEIRSCSPCLLKLVNTAALGVSSSVRNVLGVI